MSLPPLSSTFASGASINVGVVEEFYKNFRNVVEEHANRQVDVPRTKRETIAREMKLAAAEFAIGISDAALEQTRLDLEATEKKYERSEARVREVELLLKNKTEQSETKVSKLEKQLDTAISLMMTLKFTMLRTIPFSRTFFLKRRF